MVHSWVYPPAPHFDMVYTVYKTNCKNRTKNVTDKDKQEERKEIFSLINWGEK